MIYLVTSGSYSDYGVQAAFTDRAAAEKFVAAFNSARHWDDASIEEWQDGIPIERYVFVVSIHVGDPNDDGSATAEFRSDEREWAINEVQATQYTPWRERVLDSGKVAFIYSVPVRADDGPSAIKAGVEMIQRFRAEHPEAL